VATLMARIQIKYGKIDHFYEIMSHLVPVLERNGWKLLGAYQTQVRMERGAVGLREHEVVIARHAAGPLASAG
jgi:hypothetical protein